MVLGAGGLDDIEQYLIDSEHYGDMNEDDFFYDQLMDEWLLNQN